MGTFLTKKDSIQIDNIHSHIFLNIICYVSYLGKNLIKGYSRKLLTNRSIPHCTIFPFLEIRHFTNCHVVKRQKVTTTKSSRLISTPPRDVDKCWISHPILLMLKLLLLLVQNYSFSNQLALLDITPEVSTIKYMINKCIMLISEGGCRPGRNTETSQIQPKAVIAAGCKLKICLKLLRCYRKQVYVKLYLTLGLQIIIVTKKHINIA